MRANLMVLAIMLVSGSHSLSQDLVLLSHEFEVSQKAAGDLQCDSAIG